MSEKKTKRISRWSTVSRTELNWTQKTSKTVAEKWEKDLYAPLWETLTIRSNWEKKKTRGKSRQKDSLLSKGFRYPSVVPTKGEVEGLQKAEGGKAEKKKKKRPECPRGMSRGENDCKFEKKKCF